MNKVYFLRTLILLIICSLSLTLVAQEKFFENPNVKELQLNRDQIKVLEFTNSYRLDQLNEVWQNHDKNVQEYLKQARKEVILNFKSVLLPEQKSQLSYLIQSDPIPQKIRIYKWQVQKAKSEYHRKNIIPVNDEKRRALDELIDTYDRQLIQDIRAELARNTALHNGNSIKPQRAYHKAILQGHRLVSKENLELIEDMADKYIPEIQVILNTKLDQEKQWSYDLAQIEQNLWTFDSNLPEETTYNIYKDLIYQSLNLNFSPRARFLLMDPDYDSPKVALKSESLLRPVATAPNPTTDRQQLSFDVLVPGQVQVDLVQLNGQLIKNIFYGNLHAGQNILTIDTNNLVPGIYVYRITDSAGTTNHKIIKQ